MRKGFVPSMDDKGSPGGYRITRLFFAQVGLAAVAVLGMITIAGSVVSGTEVGVVVFALGIFGATSVPFILYLRIIETGSGSFLTGLTLVGTTIGAYIAMFTGDSSTRGNAILLPLFFNWLILAVGVIADQLIFRESPPKTSASQEGDPLQDPRS